MDVTLFRMAPAKSSNQNQNQNQDPPPPPPPPEAWQAMIAATNANTQLIMQIFQERNQANQGNQGNNQNHFATLNQFLTNRQRLSAIVLRQLMLTIGSWICASISSAVMSGLRTLSSSLLSNSKIKLQNGSSSTRIPEVDVRLLGMNSVKISELTISLRAWLKASVRNSAT